MTEPADSCRLCGATSTRVLFESCGFPIIECPECLVAFTARRPSAVDAREVYAHDYYGRATDYATSLRSKAGAKGADALEVVELARRNCPAGAAHILDVGCGGGEILEAFRDAGWECWGVEPSIEMSEWTQNRIGCPVFTGLLEDFEHEPGYFDVVTALHVLEHATDPRRFLQRCSTLLGTGGVLVLEVPDFGSRASRRQGPTWVPLYPDVHLYHFTMASLARVLRGSGFTIRRMVRRGGTGLPSLNRTQDSSVGTERAWADAGASAAMRLIDVGKFITYRFRTARRLARSVYWRWLGFGEYIRCVAVRP